MQYFDRSTESPPAVFRSDLARSLREALRRFMEEPAARRAQLPPPSQTLAFGDDVLSALVRLFHGKCAFCESKAPLGIHPFRPLSEAQPLAESPEAHLYYTWLSTDWGNVYSICSLCNRSARNIFPVRQSGRGPLPSLAQLTAFAEEGYGVWRWPHRDRPLLLDPCRTRDFARYFSFDLSGGIQGLTMAGRETIEVFRLDRPDLTAARAEAFHRYFELLEPSPKGILPAAAFEFASMEFGGAWSLILRRLIGRISNRLGQPLDGTRRRQRRTLEEVLTTPRGRAAYRASIEDVRRPQDVDHPSSLRRRPNAAARRLARIEVENFKALEHLVLDLPPAIVANPAAGRESAEAATLLVLGENAAGKSSILEAIALALSSNGTRERLRLAPESFVLDPSLMGAEDGSRQRSAVVRLTFEDGAELQLQVSDRFRAVEAVEGLPQVFAYGAFRQYAAKGAQRAAGGSVATLFKPELIIRNPEDWLLRLDEAKFALIARALRGIFSVEGKLDVIERDRDNNRCLIVTEVGDKEDVRLVRTPLSVASSGFRSVLAMVCDILEGLVGGPVRRLTPLSEARPVILIDEIEAHLHPRWKMRIVSALRRMLPAATFVITTHDPLCLRGMHDGEVVVLRRVPRPLSLHDETVPVFVESVVELPNVENLTIEQLLTSDLFDMFSTDSVEAEWRLSELGSLLALRAAGRELSDAERESLAALEREVLDVLPLGSSKVQRLVMDAVAEYLRRRRALVGSDLEDLEQATKDMIVEALAGYA